MDRRAQAILRLDGGAALVVGLLVLVLRGWLSRLEGFSITLVTFMGAMNLVYASYSGSLAVRAAAGRIPSRLAIDALVVANSFWPLVCVGVVATTWPSSTIFGVAHVALEGAFVAGLALAERRYVRPFARR